MNLRYTLKTGAIWQAKDDSVPWSLQYRTADGTHLVAPAPSTHNCMLGFRSGLGGVVVSVLASGPKGRGLRPGRGGGFLRAIIIRSTPSFGREVKPEAQCRKMLRHVRSVDVSYTSLLIRKILTPSSIFPTRSQMSLLVGLPESSGGRVRTFPQPASSSSPWLSTLTYHLEDER
jgi:hypothetical protein